MTSSVTDTTKVSNDAVRKLWEALPDGDLRDLATAAMDEMARNHEIALAVLRERIGELEAAMPLCVLSPMLAEIRSRGWMVGVHNDYRLGGVFHTFWLFTKGSRCAVGEGLSDSEAIALAVAKMHAIDMETTPAT